ncbi:MAG: hypothetical protein GDA50_08995 [Alphaproteobacteria bacterium GM202ARS2]|nr:hypothetical protein [Alphaproteobacteria bacterium GM202ARS2]
MPMEISWGTFQQIWCEEISIYPNTPAFNKLSIRMRLIRPGYLSLHSDLDLGLCGGATLRWCRMLFDHPGDTPLRRIERLTADVEAIASTQFLQEEIARWLPAYLRDESHSGEFFDSLCRVSRMKFSFAFKVPNPSEFEGIMKLNTLLKSNHIYLFCISSTREEYNYVKGSVSLPEGHATALAVDGNRAAKFFDIRLGEIKIDQGRLDHFWNEYWKYFSSPDIKINSLHGYSVEKLANQEIIETRPLQWQFGT